MSTAEKTIRLTSLDGLRGLAALIVVVFHLMLTTPQLAAILHARHKDGDWVAVLAYSPLRLVWAGQEAVTIFFILSGFVLTLPFVNHRFDWLAYYPRRMVRLYIPVWAAVALALVWYSAVPRQSSPEFSWWMNAHDIPLSWVRLAADTTLIFGTTWLDSPLWSLKWEVWFSLLLPLYLLILVRWRRHTLIKIIAVLGAVQLGYSVKDAYQLKYLATFGVGVLIAARLDQLRRLVQSARHSVVRVVLALSAALLIGRWLTGGRFELGLASTIGAGILVALFATWGPAMNFGQVRVLRWLGKISFSLYLVHEPIVVSMTLLVGPAPFLLVLILALPVSLLVAVAFYRLIEVPALRLSRELGRRMQRLRPRPGDLPISGQIHP